MVESGFFFVQQIEGPDLRPCMLEQRLQQLPGEGSQVFFLEHGFGNPGGGFLALPFHLDRFDEGVERGGKLSEFIG